MARSLSLLSTYLPPPSPSPTVTLYRLLFSFGIATLCFRGWRLLFFTLVRHVVRLLVFLLMLPICAFERFSLSRALEHMVIMLRSQRMRLKTGMLQKESIRTAAILLENMRLREHDIIHVQRFIRRRLERLQLEREEVVRDGGLIRFAVPEAAQRGSWLEPAPWVRVHVNRPPIPTTVSSDVALAAHSSAMAEYDKAMDKVARVLSRWLVHDCRLGMPSVMISLTGGAQNFRMKPTLQVVGRALPPSPRSSAHQHMHHTCRSSSLLSNATSPSQNDTTTAATRGYEII